MLTLNLHLVRPSHPMLVNPWNDPRARPVLVALALVGLFSLLDLVLTVHAMRTTGMYEDNPLVVALVRFTGSPVSILSMKVLTTGIGMGLLFRLRHAAAGRVGAVLAVMLGAGVPVAWVCYDRAFEGVDPEMLKALACDPRWVRL